MGEHGEDTSADKAVEAPVEGQPEATPVDSGSSQDDSVDAAVSEALKDAEKQSVDASQVSDTDDGSTPPASADSTAIPASSGFLGELEKAGYEHSFATEADAAKAMMELRGKLAERDELATFAKQILPHYDTVKAAIEKEQVAAQPEQEPVWSPPGEYNPLWLSELQKPEEERDPVLMQKFAERHNYVAQKWQGWMHNPNDFVRDMVMPAIEGKFAEYDDKQNARQQVASLVDQHREVCDRNADKISKLMGQGIPIEGAIMIAQRDEEISKLQGKPPTAIPKPNAAVPANAPPSGVVEQEPKGEPPATKDDIERWQDPQQAGRDALKAHGYDTGPAAI